MDKDTINLIRHFFFKSMRNGWASPTAKSAISELPGAKSIRFSDGELDLLDYYFVSLDSDYSYGTTTIWLAEKPVWIMHYGGWYNELVIPFLKRALLRNYNADVFTGGRGLRGFRNGPLASSACSLSYNFHPMIS